jgi:protein-S-isoprenylcysteine O-methyltransferase Ste14
MTDDLLLRRAVVLAGCVVYWGGVLIKARRVRRQIGKSPNLRPRGAKERVLWAGWLLVIASWLAQPCLIGTHLSPVELWTASPALQTAGLMIGILLTVAGYAGTLWCYAAMGASWRIGVNRREKNPLIMHGPYAFVRHPIYAFQTVMLLGALLLLPTFWSVGIVIVHLVCVLAKASDEEAHLLTIHGDAYREYVARTGRLTPWL